MNTDLIVMGVIFFGLAGGGIFLLRQSKRLRVSKREERIDALLSRLEKVFPENPDENSIALAARESTRLLELMDTKPPLHPEARHSMFKYCIRGALRDKVRESDLVDFISGLTETLARHPDLRIGQAISNSIPSGQDLFMCRDADLAQGIRQDFAGGERNDDH